MFGKCSGYSTKVVGIGGDRSETKTAGAGHELLHRLLITTADHREGYFWRPTNLHSYGATSR